MSIKAMVYYLDNSPLMGNDKLTMVILADYADDEGECFPGHKRIAHRLNMSESGARKILYRLRDEGEVEIEEGSGIKTKTGNTNRYRLVKFAETVKGVLTGTVSQPGHPRVSQAKDTLQASRVSQAKDSDPLVTINPQLDPSVLAAPAPLTDQQEWFKVVCAIVAWDSKVLGAKEKAQVAQTITILKNAGYTLEEAKSFLEKVWMKDWRYKKDGQMPTLSQLRTEIGKLRTAALIIAKETSAYASFG